MSARSWGQRGAQSPNGSYGNMCELGGGGGARIIRRPRRGHQAVSLFPGPSFFPPPTSGEVPLGSLGGPPGDVTKHSANVHGRINHTWSS